MVAQLGDMNCIFRYFINEPVFISDSAGPVAGNSVFKWFRFSNTLKWISFRFFDEGVDTMKNLFIGFLPKEIIIPGVVRKDELHSISSFSVPLSFSSWEIDSIKRLVFFGDRKR